MGLPATATTSGAANYLTTHAAPAQGTYVKFDGKAGGYKRTADGELLPEDLKCAVIYPQIQAGWLRFKGKGNPPERKMGAIFDGFVPEGREGLGDTDDALWDRDLQGRPQDPWVFQLMVPMQAVETEELLIFTTSSVTGRNEVDRLIAQCNRMQRVEPDFYPVVKMAIGGFQHKDSRVGWVKVPSLPRIGKAPMSDMAAAITSAAGDLNDAIPF